MSLRHKSIYIPDSLKDINLNNPRVWKETRPYACTLSCNIDEKENGWYQVADNNIPENYGFNVIPLTIPSKGKKVKVSFQGLTGINVSDEQKTSAGWRYGFIYVTSQGKSIYGDMASETNGSLSFKLPDDNDNQITAHLYLVVMGAPKTHWKNTDEGKDAAWPYMVKFKGTKPLVNK